MKERDWLLENLYNPHLDVYELTTMGELNTSNTQFLDRETYKRQDIIKERFTDKDGIFQEDAFNNVYNEAARKWQQLQDNKFAKGVELSMFDTDVRRTSRIRDNHFYLGEDVNEFGMPGNPDRVKKGIEGFRTISDRTKTEAELAQFSNIYDPETGEFLNATPNDYSLTSNPIKWLTEIVAGEPLALATYDEDTVDKYGIEHKKGEYKYNDEGTYYYEKLGDRSPIGKQILSIGDLITPENSVLNQIDFFDSDDLDKSVAGVVAKNVALLAPTFISPTVAGYYYTAIIAKELSKTLPMLASLYSLVDSEYETPDWINNLAAQGAKFTSNTSHYAKENIFAFENIANLLSDVSLQFGQQHQVAKAVNYFLDTKNDLKRAELLAENFYKANAKNPKFARLIAPDGEDWKNSLLGQTALTKFLKPIEESAIKRQQLGANAALMYMSLISNYDVYNTMMDKGATQQEAALVAAASTIGMFGIDKYLGLDKLFFDEMSVEKVKAIRQVLKNEYADVTKDIYVNPQTKKTAKEWFKTGFDLGKNAIKNVGQKIKDQDLGILGKALGEGLEEVGEEFITDISKQLYDYGVFNLALGYDKTIKSSGAWENAAERYAMSLLGGFLGGGLYGIQHRPQYNRTQDWDMLDLIRNNRANELRAQVIKDMNANRLGSLDVSGTKYTRKDNEVTWLSAENEEDSQNNQIAKRVLEKIDALEAFVIGNNANLNDDQLFENMVFRDARYLAYKNASHVTGYYEEFKKRLDMIAKAESALSSGTRTKTAGPNDTTILTDEQLRNLTDEEKALRQRNIAQLQSNVDQAKKDLDLFLSGDVSLEYVQKLEFALNHRVNAPFLGINYEEWLDQRLDNILNPETFDVEKLQEEWAEHQKEVLLKGLPEAYKAYIGLGNTIYNNLLMYQELEQPYRQFSDIMKQMFEQENLNIGEFFEKNKITKYSGDSRLMDDEGVLEPEEEYNNRNTLDDYGKAMRNLRAYELNLKAWQQYFQQFEQYLQQVGYEVDANTNRRIQQFMRVRVKEALDEIKNLSYIEQGEVSALIESMKHLITNKLDFTKPEDIKNILLFQRQKDIEKQVAAVKSYLDNNVEAKVTEIDVNPLESDANLKYIFDTLEANNTDGKLTDVINGLREAYKNYEDATKLSGYDLYDKSGKVIYSSPDPEWEEYDELYNDEYEKLLVEQQGKFKSIKDAFIEKVKLLDPKYRTKEAKNTAGQVLFDAIKGLGFYRDGTTIQQVIEMLRDPNSVLSREVNKQMYIGTSEIIGQKLESMPLDFGKDASAGILSLSASVMAYGGKTLELQKQTIDKYVNFLINQYNSHPLISMQQKLQTSQKTPLTALFNKVGKAMYGDSKEMVDVNEILQQVYQDYIDSGDVNKFHLNSTQKETLKKAQNILEVTKAYIYSISNPSVQGDHFGHTSQINAFAKAHQKELTKEWKPLPEISNDYGVLLQQEVDLLLKEIREWMNISDTNILNKTNRLVNAEASYNKVKKALIDSLRHTITIDNDKYELTKNIDSSAEGLQGLVNAEQQIYKNFMNAVLESGLSYKDFFEKSNFWETVLKDNNKGIRLQNTTILEEGMEKFTSYDRALKILELISEDPYHYYQSLSNFINDNEGIVPLTIQQVGARLGQVAHSEIYKEGFKALAKYLKIDNLNVIPEMVHIDGTAGAGKTDVVLRAIRQRFYKEKALVIAPSEKQSNKLAKILGEPDYYTIDESRNDNIFAKLLPQWDKIYSDFKAVEQEMRLFLAPKLKHEYKEIDTEFFKASLENAGGGRVGVKYKLKDNIVFNKDFDQSLIFIDEAAHLNPLQLVLLGKLAEINKGTVYAASDVNQHGYKNDITESLSSSDFFITRTSRLRESLRSGNVQKQANNSDIDNILDTWALEYISGSDRALSFLHKLPKTLKGINLRIYNKDDINGDWLGADIDEVIKILESLKGKEIGFVGDANSPIAIKLKNAGLLQDQNILSEQRIAGKQHMQGDEFDYVIVDSLEKIPDPDRLTNTTELIDFLGRFNTLSTRSKQGTIFMDSFSKIFGENKQETIKSPGFDIQPAVKLYREPYLQQLNSLKIEEIKFNKTVKKEEIKVEKIGDEYAPKLDQFDDKTNPELDSDVVEEELQRQQESIQNEYLESLGEKRTDEEKGFEVLEENLDLFIEANLTAPVIGLDWTDTLEDGSPREYRKWLGAPEPVAGDVRRNASAFVYEDVTSIEKKKEIQDALSSIQSAIIYGEGSDGQHKVRGLATNFSNFREVWDNRKLYVEFRPATKEDFFGVGTGLKNTFIKIGDTNYVGSVVLKLEGLRRDAESSAFDAIYDISLLNDPNYLKRDDVQKQIRTNLEKKLETGRIPESRRADVESFVKNLTYIAEQWESFVKEVVADMKNKGQKTALIELEEGMYRSNNATSLHSIDYPLRLGGYLNLQDVDYKDNVELVRNEETGEIEEVFPKDYNSFMDKDNRKVVSPVYIVGKKSDTLKGIIDESTFGRAAVFVSGNTNLSPDELAEIWLKQKEDPEGYDPVVRMVPLTNHGVNFSEFITHRIQNQFPGQGKPHRMDVLGVKMFTAIWNFRAALQRFQDVLKQYKKINSNEDKLEAILNAEADLYEEFKDEGWSHNWNAILDENSDRVKKVLQSYPEVTIEDVKKLMKFNLEDCLDIPIFRLGTDRTTKQSGGYVRFFDVTGSQAYKNKDNKVGLIAISPKAVTRYNIMLDTLLRQLTTNEVPDIYKANNIEYKPVGIRIVDSRNESWDTKTFIGNDDRKTTGMIRTTGEGIRFGEVDPEDSTKFVWEYTIDNGKLFSFIPKILSSIATNIKHYQKNAYAGFINISTLEDVYKEDVKSSVNIQIAPFFEKGGLEQDVSDNGFINMLDLIFHGTNGHIENNIRTGEKRSPYTEEAPFKYGIFVDPELESLPETYMYDNVRGINNQNWTLLRCGTNLIFFDVNVQVRPGGIRLNLNKLMDTYRGKKVKEERKEEEKKVEKKTGKTYSERLPSTALYVNEYKSELLNSDKYTDDEEGYKKFIADYKWQKINGVIRNNPIRYTEESDIKHIIELINENLGDKGKIDSMIFNEPGNKYEFFYEGRKLEIKKSSLSDELRISNRKSAPRTVSAEQPKKSVDEDGIEDNFNNHDSASSGLTHNDFREAIKKLMNYVSEQGKMDSDPNLLEILDEKDFNTYLGSIKIKENKDKIRNLIKLIEAKQIAQILKDEGIDRSKLSKYLIDSSKFMCK